MWYVNCSFVSLFTSSLLSISKEFMKFDATFTNASSGHFKKKLIEHSLNIDGNY